MIIHDSSTIHKMQLKPWAPSTKNPSKFFLSKLKRLYQASPTFSSVNIYLYMTTPHERTSSVPKGSNVKDPMHYCGLQHSTLQDIRPKSMEGTHFTHAQFWDAKVKLIFSIVFFVWTSEQNTNKYSHIYYIIVTWQIYFLLVWTFLDSDLWLSIYGPKNQKHWPGRFNEPWMPSTAKKSATMNVTCAVLKHQTLQQKLWNCLCSKGTVCSMQNMTIQHDIQLNIAEISIRMGYGRVGFWIEFAFAGSEEHDQSLSNLDS